MKTAVLLMLIITLTPVMPDVPVRFYAHAKNGNVWTETLVGECLTDENGSCELRVSVTPWEDGLIRGRLDAGEHGQRPLITPGGEMNVTLATQSDHHGETRYEYLPLDTEAAPLILPKATNWLGWWALFMVALIWGSVWYFGKSRGK